MMGFTQQEVFSDSLLMGFAWNEKDPSWVTCRLKIRFFLQCENLCYLCLSMTCINLLCRALIPKVAPSFTVQHVEADTDWGLESRHSNEDYCCLPKSIAFMRSQKTNTKWTSMLWKSSCECFLHEKSFLFDNKIWPLGCQSIGTGSQPPHHSGMELHCGWLSFAGN